VLLYASVISVSLLITFLIYQPGISGPFLLDDYSNLESLGRDGGVNNLQAVLQFVFGNTSGPTGRPVSMLSFLIDGSDWPAAAEPYKYTNVMLHLLCGLLLGWFALLLFTTIGFSETKAQLAALAVALIWLLHPLNVSTALYVVQRMTQLMTIFSLTALICYMKGVKAIANDTRKGLLLLFLCLFPFGLLAVLSKENGALLLLAILVLESTVFANGKKSRWHRLWLNVAVRLPLLGIAAYIAIDFRSLTEDYTYRNFDLLERLLTQSRILCDYLFNIFAPRASGFGVFHDDVVASSSLINPITTLTSIVFLGGLIFSSLALRIKQPILSFGVFWFVGWHLMESTFLPLELYFEHRNYLAMIGPIIAAVYYAGNILSGIDAQAALRGAQAVVVVIVVILAGMTLQLTQLWGNTGALLLHWAENKPGSVRAQVVIADTLASVGNPEVGHERLLIAQQFNPNEATLLLHSWNFSCQHGTPQIISLEQISAMSDLEFFRDDINYQLRTFIENLDNSQCNYPSQAQVLALMNKLSELPMRPWDRANFHFLFSDIYVYYRQLDPALVELRNAFEYRPSADIPLRQAVLSASAGNYEDSLLFLDRAREADANRGPLLPSRLDEIEGMQRDLRTRLGSN
jgi:hypothetical protein